MDDKIQEQLKKYFGEDEELSFEKTEENDVIAKSLETINEYKEEFPDDLEKAIGVIAKQTGFCDIVVSKILEKKNEHDDKVEKTGAKFSKDTLKKLTDALATLKSILPALAEKTEKSDKTEIEKTIKEVEKKLAGLEKNKEDDVTEQLTKTLTELTKRIATVEKGTGIKKGIDGQDNDDDTADKKWPSFSSNSDG